MTLGIIVSKQYSRGKLLMMQRQDVKQVPQIIVWTRTKFAYYQINIQKTLKIASSKQKMSVRVKINPPKWRIYFIFK